MTRLVIALFVILLGAAPARAQEPITRSDSAEVLVGVAERLHAQGSDELAEALARLVQRRYADTGAAERAAALLAAVTRTGDTRAGRIGLISFTTIYGAWLGVAVPAMFDANSAEIYGLGLLLGGPVGFFGGRAYADGRSVSAGDAGAVTWSTLFGSWQGAGWNLAIDRGMVCDIDYCYDDDPDAQSMFASMVAGGLVGMAGSMLAADRTDIDGGTATMLGWGSLWGTGAGLVVAAIADLEGEHEPLVASLIGGDLGFGSMAVLAPGWNMSTGRAWLINAAGVMGGAIGAGVDLLVQPSNTDVAIMIPTIGVAIGLGAGAHLTRDMEEGRVRRGSLDVDASPALVRLRDGEWAIGLPQPAPALLRDRASGPVEPGIRVQLLDARF